MKNTILTTIAILFALNVTMIPDAYADTKSVQDIRQKAEEGDPQSQINVGIWHLDGREWADRDCDKAREWFLKAADQGYEEAAQQLFFTYGEDGYFGSNCEEDKKKAVFWLQKSAEMGSSSSQWMLGKSYKGGTYTEKNCGKAIYWLQEAENSGFVLYANYATKELEEMSPTIREQDSESLSAYQIKSLACKAVKECSRLAQKGSDDAQFALAILKLKENKSDKEAVGCGQPPFFNPVIGS